jgi:hypothetical protein
VDVPGDTEATVITRVRTYFEGTSVWTHRISSIRYVDRFSGVGTRECDSLEVIIRFSLSRDPEPLNGEGLPHRDIPCGHDTRTGVRKLNGVRRDVPHIGDGREVIGGNDLDETHLDPLTHHVPVDGEDIRGVSADIEIRADREDVLGS